MSLDGKRIMRYLIPVALCFLSVAYTSTIGNCTFDGCQTDRYCNQTTGACQLCRDHADDCLTTRQKSECNQVCFTERCSALPELKNGNYNGERVNQSQRYGDEVTITCNTGFHVTGPSKNVCGSYGRWKNQFASCDVNTCYLVTNIVNGRAILPENKKSLSYGDTVEYMCDNGFDLVGSTVARCNEHGEWNTSTPSCQRKVCLLPEPIANGHHNGTSSVVFGDVLEFSCMDNFRLEGNTYLTCQPDGNWDRQIPVCRDIQYAKPPRLMNGYYKERSERYLVRSSVLYGCYSGYRINGPQYQLWTCQENGVWDKNTVPICEKVQLKETVCIQPVELKNGGIIETERSEFPVGTSVHYICNEGYFKIDKDYSVWTCTKKGEWDKARVPTCEKLEHDGCSYTGTILVTVIIVLVFQVIIILLIVIGRKFGLDKKFFQKIRNYNIHGDSFNIHGPNAGVSVQNDDGSEKTRLSSDEEH